MLDLFTRWIDTPDVRTTDPATSVMAAEDSRPRRMSQAVKLLRVYADGRGLTDEEAVQEAGLVSAGSPWKRCSDLRKSGLITPTGRLANTTHGSAAQVCVITDQGRRELAMRDPLHNQPQPVRLGRAEV